MNFFPRKVFLALALFLMAAAVPAWCQTAPGSFMSGPMERRGNNGREMWSRVNAAQTWTMLRDDNQTFPAKTVGRATLNGNKGTVVQWSVYSPHGGDSTKIFIPDIGSADMRLYYQAFRKTTWNPYLGAMSQVAPLDERQVASLKRELALRQARAQSESQKQAFFNAIRRGDITQVRSTLRRNPSWVNTVGTLHISAYYHPRYTALGAAALFDQTEIARLLLQRGASRRDLNLHLNMAVHEKKEQMVRFLVGAGANVNAKDQFGEPLLHLAVRRGSKKMAQLLKSLGADLRAENRSGYTASEYARLDGNPVLADLLRPR